MADQDSPRTEAATPRKREEAARKGQFAISSDLSTGLLLLTAVTFLWLGGPGVMADLMAAMRDGLSRLPHEEWGIAQTTVMFQSMFWRAVGLCAGMLGVMAAVGVAIGGWQTGFAISPQALSIDWERLSPARGWNRIASSRAAVKAAMTGAKATAIGLLVVWMTWGRLDEMARAGRGPLARTAADAWRDSLWIAASVAGALLLLGIVDFLFQRWKHEEDLKMTRKEAQDDHRDAEGDPMVKARMRKLQREMARNRMIGDVKTASVVMRNPTHFAVALRYEPSMAAPKVVAKGRGFWAQRIIDEAEKHGVPVVEHKPLARALFAAVEIGQEIPIEFYQAVVEVLVYLYRLKRAG